MFTLIKQITGKLGVLFLGFFFFTFLAFNPKANASHFAGAEITYVCVGPNTYQITLNYFRDCSGINYGNTEYIRVSGCSGTPSSIAMSNPTITDVTPLCPGQTSSCNGGSVPGIQQWTYVKTVSFPASCTSLVLSAESCCRNPPITTLNNPSSNSWYVATTLYNNAAACNGSPVFLNPAVATGCVNQVVNYNHGVSDPDGDQLVFSLGDCYQSSNSTVNYKPGFSGTNPLSTTSGVSINPSTGAITFTPNLIQVGVLCVVVEEYRNGVKIGEISRDIQFNITNCGANNNPTASGPFIYNTLPGQQVCFNITGNDVDGDLINMTTNNGITGGTFSPALPSGFQANPSTQFCWTPGAADENQTHFFTITVQDDACPTAGINTYTYQVVVGSGCDDPVADCKNITVQLDGNGQATITASQVDNNSTYDCGLQSMTVSPSSFGCGNIGANSVTLTINDDEGNSDNCTATVTVEDDSKPVPNVSNLPTITGQCGASVTPPTATDNCAGSITGTTNDPLSYNSQGTFYITWTYDDGNGNSKTQTQTVIVDDTTDPVPDVANLPTIIGQCGASVTPPTATDNCAGSITGTTNDPLSYNSQGTFYITWTYDDGNGNSETQTQTVIVDDTTDPVPDVANLPTVTGQCGASVTPPTATDNCAGSITGTTNDPLSYNSQGTFYITWTYDDGNGNSETQTQTVIVDDTTDPVPDVANLPTVTGQCGASVTPPTATDNCAGSITGTTNDQLSYASQGTYYITWTYDDGNGNSKTQVQTVIVDDTMDPVPDLEVLPTITGQCDASVTPPTATDNCSGSITGTTNDPLSYGAQGTYYITWTYDDGNGNSETQVQTVIIEDTTPPVISCPGDITKANDSGQCGAVVTFNVSASDNCGQVTYICTIGGDEEEEEEDEPSDCFGNNIDLSITFDNYPEETSWMILDALEQVVASGGTYGSEPDGSTLDLFFNLPDGEYMFMIRDQVGDGICCGYGNGSYTLSSGGEIIATGGNFGFGEKTYFCVETPSQGGGGGLPLTEVQSGDFFPVGTYTVTCTATDGSGLTDVCTFDITVNDTEAPTLVDPCPDNITLCGAQPVSWDPPTATDNCGVVSSQSNYNPGDFFEVGSYTVTYTFYDETGWSVSCSFLITINPKPEVEITQEDLPTWCQGVQVLTANVLNPDELTYPLTFEWSGDLGNSSTVVAPDNGIYFVTVTDALGCFTVESTVVDEDISSLLSAYTIISGEEFEMYESQVLGGGVGIEDADEAEIADNSSIFTFLKADMNNVQIDGSSYVDVVIDDDFDVPLPPFQSNPYISNNHVNVPANATVTLNGNNYGYVSVGTGATLIINASEIYIFNLTTKKDATIIFNQPTEMMIRRKMYIGETNLINPEGFTSVIFVSDNAQVGQGSVVNCSIYAPEGLDVNDSGSSLTTYMNGIFISNDRIFSDHLVVWNWNLNCSFIDSGDPVEPEFNESIDPGVTENTINTKNGLTVFPNPNSGVFQVDVAAYEGKAIDLIIYDQLGRQVWNYATPEVQQSVIRVDMNSGAYTNGVYMLNLKSEGESEVEMFILDK